MAEPTDVKKLEVLVVDDSPLIRHLFMDLLTGDTNISVSTAADPVLALHQMRFSQPDVIILDIEMPRMDGMTFLKRLMQENPVPVIICSVYAQAGSQQALQALEQGAVEIIAKPKVDLKSKLWEQRERIIDCIHAASRAKIGRLWDDDSGRNSRFSVDAVLRRQPPVTKCGSMKLVAIGASTGGTVVLSYLLASLSEETPGMVIVQHMPAGFTWAFAHRLNATSRLQIKEAESGDEIREGQVYIAPGDYHTMVYKSGERYRLRVIRGPMVNRHRPSVDVLFRSVAQAAGENAMGILLTGMGVDGAQGLLEMKQSGATTLAQSEDSCAVYGMPQEACRIGAVKESLSVEGILKAIRRFRISDP